MQLFIALVGHNASGKTYVAKRLEEDLQLNRINGDDFRAFISEHIRYFNDLDISIKNPRYELLTDLVVNYRFEMSWLLLKAGQSLIYDGSGATKAWRAKYLDHVKQYYPAVHRVIIHTDITEPQLLERLQTRGQSWETQYRGTKKTLFEPPAQDEADTVLVYNQRNYDEILAKIQALQQTEKH